jgi:hypothetical protein
LTEENRVSKSEGRVEAMGEDVPSFSFPAGMGLRGREGVRRVGEGVVE